uniref:NADH-ubiquinone oxidoreductase chain 4 n=1 Tax=Prosevania sp. ZJUH_2016031 TaxID=2491170 RepID=A0A3Q8UAC5_9HYME|nr:NADH dehydrogenase subunit 4 [Prosevania sp. ZJUH_2016031]
MVSMYLCLIFLFIILKNYILIFSQLTILLFYLMFLINVEEDYFSVFSIWGFDLAGFVLSLLTLWISILIFLVIIFFNFNVKSLMNYMILLTLVLFMFFSSMNLMVFYLLFELALIPIFFLILGWGGISRIEAGIYMMIYALISSLPFFGLIFYIDDYFKSLSFLILKMDKFFVESVLLNILMILMFVLKLPLFMFHMWLPKAHVEAPVFGSMILAGILLKLGGYGVYNIYLICWGSLVLSDYLIFYSLIGMLFISWVCIFQLDLKVMIAYSSVIHMNMFLAGILTLSFIGYGGGLIMMIAHGLSSSGLFCLVNLSYLKIMTRNILINKGLMNMNNSLSLMWLILCLTNLGVPPFLNFFCEVMLLNSVLWWSNFSMIILFFILLFNSYFNFQLFSFSQHGKYSEMFYFNLKLIDYMVLILHIYPLFLLIFCLDIFFM